MAIAFGLLGYYIFKHSGRQDENGTWAEKRPLLNSSRSKAEFDAALESKPQIGSPNLAAMRSTSMNSKLFKGASSSTSSDKRLNTADRALEVAKLSEKSVARSGRISYQQQEDYEYKYTASLEPSKAEESYMYYI